MTDGVQLISYAQNFEDVILWRALGHVTNGFFIDIGAQDPVVDSVSLLFHERGWRGVHVEPTVHYCALLRAKRHGDIVIQGAVGDQPGVATFFEIHDSGLSTLDPLIAAKHRELGFDVGETTTPVVTLASVLEASHASEVHWLKIDVEGFESHVLRSWNECAMRPWVVVVESTLPLTQNVSYADWEPLLLERDYAFVYFDGLNRYYLSRTHPELHHALSVPPNVFDGFAVSGTANSAVHRVIAERHAQELAAINEKMVAAAQQASAVHEAMLAERALADAEADKQIRIAQQVALEASHGHEQRVMRLRRELFEVRESSLASARAEASRERALWEQIHALHREHSVECTELHKSQAERERTWVEQARSSELLLRAELDRARMNSVKLEQKLRLIEQTWVWRILKPFVASFRRENQAHAVAAAPVAMQISMPTETTTFEQQGSAMNQSTAAYQSPSSIEELLALRDEAFVKAAYLALLGRPADPVGLAGLLAQLRSGTEKERLVSALKNSDEGKAAQSELPGLASLMERVSSHRASLIGRALRKIGGSALRPISIQLRGIDEQLRELRVSTDQRMDRLESMLLTLSQSTGANAVMTPQDRAELAQMSPHGRDLYFRLKDAATQRARISMS